MILYAMASFQTFMDECDMLRNMEFLEVAAHRGGELNLASDLYESIEEAGGFKCIIAYDGEAPIGYITIVTSTLPHDDNREVAQVDLIYVHPEYRKHRIGIQLYKMAEVELGATNPGILWRASMTLDGLSERKKRSGLAALGFKATEVVFEKVIA